MGRKRKNINGEEAPKIKKPKQEEERMEDFTPLPPQVREQHNRLDREYFDILPPGYRFEPTGAELIVDYLWNKLMNLPMPLNRIRDANVYSAHPRDLTSQYKLHRGKEWYFFTPRTKKYPNGQRPDRAAGNGYWKATGAVPIHDNRGVKIGTKKTLVYYEGIPKEKNTTKTDWIMHEYRIADDFANNVDPDAKKDGKELDKCVLCMIYDKSSKEEPDANENQQDDNNMMIVPANNGEYPYQNPNGAGPIIPVQNWQVQSPNTDQGQDGANFNDTSHLLMQNVNVQNDSITQELEFECAECSITHEVYGERFHITESGPYGGGFDNTASLHMQNDSPVVGNNLCNTVGLPLSYDDQGQNIYARQGPYSEFWMNGHDQQGLNVDPLAMVQAQNQYEWS